MSITATEAKNRFGYFCSQAKTAPVVIEKDGRPDTVLIGYAEFQELQAARATKTLASRKKEFNETYKDWIDAQKCHFNEHGVWCEGLVSWTKGR